MAIRSPSALAKVHGAQSRCTKYGTGLYEILESHGEYNVESILHNDEHRLRRQIWDRATSARGSSYVPSLLVFLPELLL